MGAFFKNCLLWQKIDTNALNLPPDVPLPGREKNIPYVFLGDGAFALHRDVMKPFPGNHDMGTNERTFNYRLSSSRVIVENTFEKSPYSRNLYTPPGTFDIIENGVFIEGSWRQRNTGLSALRTIPPVARRAETTALQVRSEFAAYFNNVNL
ncbi:hypothetical protein NQ314_016236 [Rhamnusium bicolor]|uniref:DDE Tnp4 domain-containing protein n=1 Tax=Rhamnusium bicolor TaxID=1586634 RepID=A0AAV8WXS6_9CUCU|nr:hypothetical protein NQ314_016236 [Rhamnusium bicolor]